MNRERLSDRITLYRFDPLAGKHFGNTILALHDGKRVLLIDTGYEEQGAAVYRDIREMGWVLGGVIISHFHDDHMQGLKALPKVPVYGSSHFGATLDLWTKREEHHLFTPSVPIERRDTLRWGEHRIELVPFPGHSPCTVITLIDDSWVHIADELMYSNEGVPVLPCTDPGAAERHRDSLHRLRDYLSAPFIPSHGPVMSDTAGLRADIRNRIAYFEAVLNGGGRIPYHEAVRNCDCGFLHSEWHESLYD